MHRIDISGEAFIIPKAFGSTYPIVTGKNIEVAYALQGGLSICYKFNYIELPSMVILEIKSERIYEKH